MARIEDAALTERRYAIPKGFDPNSYYRDTFGLFVGGGPSFRFRVRFSKELADEIRERQWHQDQKIEETPKTAGSSWSSRSDPSRRHGVSCWSTDPAATVLSPPELVEDVRRQVEKMRGTYEGREAAGGRPAGKAKGGAMRRFTMLFLAAAVSCAPATSGLKPVGASEAETACPGGRRAWNLAITDLRASARTATGFSPSSAIRSRSRFRAASGRARLDPATPTIAIEIHRLGADFDGSMYDAAAEWSVVASTASGQALTQFEADATVSRPNYAGSNNEREALRGAFEKALSRTAVGLRNLPEVP